MSSLHRRQFVRHMLSASAAIGIAPTFRNAFAASAPNEPDEDNALKKDLIFRTTTPRNAEPQLNKLVESWMTPTSQFYIRSHAPNPVIDPQSFRLSIEGLVERPIEISLAQLTSQFPHAGCVCTLTCAGNRRYEHTKTKTVGGVQWEEGPIGNASWSGVRLSDVLKFVGVGAAAKHVWFDGLDQVVQGDATIPFGGSVPLKKVFEEDAAMPGVLLATQMNDAPLTADHGFPLRTVVPGYIGARSVKWLGRITVSDRPSPNYYVADAYKMVETGAKIEWDETAPIYRYPINAALCSAAGNLQSLKLKGYALPTGNVGTIIQRVEISADNGSTWVDAQLDSHQDAFCWRFWSATVSPGAAAQYLLVRATDSSGHVQPETVAWNPKGYLYNAWHKVPLQKLLK